MTREDNRPGGEDALRKRAEETVREKTAQATEDGDSLPGETRRILHELRVHQIELTMQNEELHRAQARNLLLFRPNLKRLFMSGYSADVIVRHGVLDPGMAFIQKPFSTKSLAQKVREALDQK